MNEQICLLFYPKARLEQKLGKYFHKLFFENLVDPVNVWGPISGLCFNQHWLNVHASEKFR